MLKKRIALILAAALAVLTVSACGDSGSTAAVESAEQPAPAASTQENKDAPAAAEQIEIVYWQPTSSSLTAKTRDEFNAKFEAENPGVKVSVVPQPNDNFDNLFKAANLAGNGPDIVQLWPGTPTTDYKDFLVPLNQYISEEDLAARSGWNLVTPGFGSTGDILGIPMDAYVYGIWYNKDLMLKGGFDPENPPKTWDELLVLCENLKQAGITPFCIGSKDGYMAQWGIGVVLNTLMGSDFDKLLNNPLSGSDFEKSIEIWQQLAKGGYLNKDTASISTGDEQVQRFVSGGGAMILSGNWEAQALLELFGGQLGENIGFMKPPAADPNNPNADYNYSGPGAAMCLTKYGKNIDLSAKYITGITSEEYQIKFCNELFQLPTLSGIDENKLEDPMLREFYSMMKSGKNSVLVDLIPLNAYNEMVRLGSLINTAQITPAEVCEIMDEEIAKSK